MQIEDLLKQFKPLYWLFFIPIKIEGLYFKFSNWEYVRYVFIWILAYLQGIFLAIVVFFIKDGMSMDEVSKQTGMLFSPSND